MDKRNFERFKLKLNMKLSFEENDSSRISMNFIKYLKNQT